MIINNKEISTRLRLGFMLFALVYMAIIVLSLIFSKSDDHMLEIVSSIIFLLFVIYFVIMRFSYIYYNSEGSKILLRYSPLQPLLYGNYSIEVPKKSLVKFEIVDGFFGLRKSLLLYVKTPQGVAKYKPVSLSTLTKKEIEQLVYNLENIVAA
ncbi:MAG TPA: hypothetical protein PLO05_07690 [Bacteroidales bacterium]|jgi:hypothetical protein|nr:hypothetical protein [Bacteroidales bacterium]MDY0160379.1 hypothetical protein [Bacteroidales bacterium]HXK82021.1 hypothetical protein [Bacteroidales bacterium]